MSKVKINKKLQKSSVLKVVGLVFMVVTLLTALVLTNNTVRQFITDSFAFDYECGAYGSPGARNQCQQRNDDNRRSAILKAKATQYNNVSVWLAEQVNNGRMSPQIYQNVMDALHKNLYGN